jgi:hypothetical protein
MTKRKRLKRGSTKHFTEKLNTEQKEPHRNGDEIGRSRKVSGLSLRIIIWRIGEGGQASFTLGPKNYLGGPGYHLCVPLVVVTIHPLFPLL